MEGMPTGGMVGAAGGSRAPPWAAVAETGAAHESGNQQHRHPDSTRSITALPSPAHPFSSPLSPQVQVVTPVLEQKVLSIIILQGGRLLVLLRGLLHLGADQRLLKLAVGRAGGWWVGGCK